MSETSYDRIVASIKAEAEQRRADALLAALADLPDGATVTELGRLLSTDHGTLGRTLRRLVTAGTLTATTVRTPGKRGRPPTYYRLRPEETP